MKKKTGARLMRVALTGICVLIAVDLILGQVYPKVHQPIEYGHSPVARKTVKRKIEDVRGEFRRIRIDRFDHDFRRWPKGSPTKPRVLIVGDSMTAMNYVSNGEEWYAYLEEAFPHLDFFVFGGGGYSTLEEFLVIDEHLDRINPAAFILQFCVNDYADNHYSLDRRRYPFNNHLLRPYWEGEEIVYRLPLPLSALRAASFSLDQLLHRYDRRRWNQVIRDLDEYNKQAALANKQLSPEQLKEIDSLSTEAVALTQRLAKRIRSRIGDIPGFLFQACARLTDDDRSVCEAGSFHCIDGVQRKLNQIKATGQQVTVENNGHWNRSGNQIVGEFLAEKLQKSGGLPAPR